MRWLLLVMLAGCGRVDFESRRATDAAVDTVTIDALPPRVVARTTRESPTSAALAIEIPPVQVGSLVVVAIASHDGRPVSSVTSAGTPFTSAGVRAEMANTASELWYSYGAAGQGLVTVAFAQPSNFDVWVVELAGLAGPPVAMAAGCVQYPPAVARAAVPAAPGQLVFGVSMLAFPAFENGLDAPFTSLGDLTGNGAAYYVPDAPGSYGPQWQVGQGAGMAAMTCSSTLAFDPA